MAKRRRKASLHSTGKVTEADILERARELAEDPTLAMPICEDGCIWFSPVAAARRGIMRAYAARDNEAKLQRLSRRGNELAKAYAATILLAHSEKIPYVADLKMPFGSVPYVVRGAARPFPLAGLQHHDDRKLRLLAVTPWVKNRGLHFFSADRGIVCTARSAKPPQDFIDEELARLALRADATGRHVCVHGGADAQREGVRLVWRAAEVELERCIECTGDGSTLHAILEHIAAPSPASHFDVIPRLRPLRAVSGAPPDVDYRILDETLRDYQRGTFGDRGLLEAARTARTEALRAQGDVIYVAGNTSYGADRAAFLDALGPTEAERRALEAGLEARHAPVVLDKATTARALADLWPDHGLLMLEAAAGDSEVAQRLHREKVAPDEVADLVRQAERQGSTRSALAELPDYASLPPAAAAAHAVAIAYRTQGSDAAVRVALERAQEPQAKGMVLAMLRAMQAAKGQDWRFSHTDVEAAASVTDPVEKLLRGEATDYHDALLLASRLMGETQDFAPQP